MIKTIVIIVIAAILCVILKQQKNDLSFLISTTATVVICLVTINKLIPIFNYTYEINVISSDILEILIKTLGISYLTDFSSSICKDLGENGLAAGAELCGKVEIIILAIPVFSNLLEVCTSLIN